MSFTAEPINCKLGFSNRISLNVVGGWYPRKSEANSEFRYCYIKDVSWVGSEHHNLVKTL